MAELARTEEELRTKANNGHDFGPPEDLSARCLKCGRKFTVIAMMSSRGLPPCPVGSDSWT